MKENDEDEKRGATNGIAWETLTSASLLSMNLRTTCLRYIKLTSLSSSLFTLAVCVVKESWAPLGTDGEWAVSDTTADDEADPAYGKED